MIISFECKCDELIPLLDKFELEDRDFTLSHFLYAGFMSFLTYQIENMTNELEALNDEIRLS